MEIVNILSVLIGSAGVGMLFKISHTLGEMKSVLSTLLKRQDDHEERLRKGGL